MKSSNKNLMIGIVLIILGALAIFWNFGLLNIFEILNIAIPILIILLGLSYIMHRDSRTLGTVMLFIGIIFLLVQLGVPFRIIISVALIGAGVCLITGNVMKSIFKKGVFRDSRDHIIISEFLSDTVINSVSLNVSSANVRSYFSKVVLDFSNAELNLNLPVNLDVVSFLGDIKIITKANWNVMVNGKVFRKVEGVYSTINIKCNNFLGNIDID